MSTKEDSACDPEELYKKFLQYAVNKEDLIRWGYPYEDSSGNVTYRKQFRKSTNPAKQVCRCGEKISMHTKNWFQATNFCCYHPGKRYFDGNFTYFDCCNRSSAGGGCALSNYHTISFYSVETPFKKTKKQGDKSQAHACNVFALDCEMVYTIKGLELARVSVLSVDGETVYDSLVKPKNLILDYNTEFSGVNFKLLKDVTTALEDVQDVLLQLINEDTILVGHGLENDLLALNLLHYKIVDTALVFPHQNGYPYRPSLKDLSMAFLNKSFQQHDSVQDANACIELMLQKVFPQKKQFCSSSASGDEVASDKPSEMLQMHSYVPGLSVPYLPQAIPPMIAYNMLPKRGRKFKSQQPLNLYRVYTYAPPCHTAPLPLPFPIPFRCL